MTFKRASFSFGVGLMAACAPADTVPTTSAPLPVSAHPVSQQAEYTVVRRFNGLVRSGRSSALGFERPGRIITVHVDEGDLVKRGQLVAELDRAQLEAGRRRLVASLRQATAGVGIARLTAARLKKLAEERFTSRQASDEASFGLKAAIAEQDGLRAAIREIDVDLDKTKLYAPFAGQVSARLVDEGTVVSAGAPVIRFLEGEAKEAVVGVPASTADALANDQHIDLDIAGRTVPARIKHRVPDIDPRTRTVSLIFALGEDVRAADGEVVVFRHSYAISGIGFWVPTTALTQGLRGLWSVYALDEDGPSTRVRREEVHVLYAETDRAYVRGTLQSGDRIIINGLRRVVPGQHVLVNAPIADVDGLR